MVVVVEEAFPLRHVTASWIPFFSHNVTYRPPLTAMLRLLADCST